MWTVTEKTKIIHMEPLTTWANHHKNFIKIYGTIFFYEFMVVGNMPVPFIFKKWDPKTLSNHFDVRVVKRELKFFWAQN